MKKILIKNKKVGLKYEILDKFEAGLSLFGFEVKSLRQQNGSLKGSYIKIHNNEVFLINAQIPPFQPANAPDSYNAYRERKLLLNKKEINKLVGITKKTGLTITPISVYNSGGKLKIEIAVARGKKKHDKRETLKKRDSKRKIERTLKNQ